MRKLPLVIILLLLLIIILPALVVRSCRNEATEPPPAVDRAPIESPAGEITLQVFNHHLDEVQTMTLEEYLVGVVAAEMPASFDIEALKAQAVVARTYTVNQMLSFGGKGCDKHGQTVDICTNFAHCQAWESEEESLNRWPQDEGPGYLNKIRQAVRETAGEVALHDNELIDAVFHAHCGGQTENSEDVWTTALAYLRGVDCPYCEGTRWSETEHVFSSEQFAQKLLPYVSAVPVSSTGSPLLDAATRTSSGRVLQLSVAGEAVSGRDIRTALGLPSTNFTWQATEDQIIFTNKGYGHGVGLCQYGADGKAKAGNNYKEIIEYFYTDVTVDTLSP
ncbi:stage II sporulation protein D [Dethiobacter alkaliphilus]|uniref:stage II sporulation protein D n=1 Tax=Dethiobacter alkaliphilus TaxID=427926 RepID=UPI0022272D6E|nr:stage II sporulation protein D [Dethiobacter alkaliphilus]MCW3488848.1 stage II sporulation protein D [Dethiobacter alkaliphilus]